MAKWGLIFGLWTKIEKHLNRKKIYLVRHGQTIFNLKRCKSKEVRIACRPFWMQTWQAQAKAILSIPINPVFVCKTGLIYSGLIRHETVPVSNFFLDFK